MGREGGILHSHGDNYLPLWWLEEGERDDRILWYTVYICIYDERQCIELNLNAAVLAIPANLCKLCLSRTGFNFLIQPAENVHSFPSRKG